MPWSHSFTLALTLVILVCITPVKADVERVNSPFYGEALFDFNQQNYFSSIVQLEKEISLGRLADDAAEAEALLGSLYLSFGLHRHAQTIFESLLETHADEKSRNLAWFYLAKIQYQRGYYELAAAHLEKINSTLPVQYEDERMTLMALILLQLKDNQAAIDLLNQVIGDGKNVNYARFNLAIATLNAGDTSMAISLLSKSAEAEKPDAESAALIDRINYSLGYQYLEQEQFETAQLYFNRVGFHGPFSNQALLGLGWAAFGLNNYGAAMAAWRELAGRDTSDTNVLEAYLALPYLSYKVKSYSNSVDEYRQAIEIYEDELAQINQLLNKNDFSELVMALVDLDANDEIGWRWQNDVLEGPLLNRYMLRFVSSHEFQESLKNYRDLLFIDRNLKKWSRSIDVYADIIDVKTAAYAEFRPQAEKRLKELSDNRYAEATKLMKNRLSEIEEDENALALLNKKEQEQYNRLRSIDYRLSYNLDELDDKLSHLKVVQRANELLKQHARLDGLFRWDVMISYKQRLWDVKKNLKQLEAENKITEALRLDIEKIIQALPKSFDGHSQRLSLVEDRLKTVGVQVSDLLGQYNAYLQSQIRDELLAAKKEIEIYRSQAMLSVAHIYDLNLKLNRASQ